MRISQYPLAVCLFLLITQGLRAQAPPPAPPSPSQPAETQDKHAFGVLPNYRTAEGNLPYAPISTKQKFTIASQDTIDGPSFILAAGFSALSQLSDEEPSFGQELKGYAHRYGTGLADQVIGNYMTEAIMPTLFHQDPRYFRKGTGSFGARVGWAVTRSLIARGENGKWQFNYSEWIGNGADAAIGNAYYPDDRGFSPTMQRMLMQVGTDTVSQVFKEFWPDVKRKFFKKSAAATPAADPKK